MQRAKLEKILKNEGFIFTRYNGSHQIWTDTISGLITTVVIHGKNHERNAVRAVFRDIERIKKQRTKV